MSLQKKRWKTPQSNGKRNMSTASAARLHWPWLLLTAGDRQLCLWSSSHAFFQFSLMIILQPRPLILRGLVCRCLADPWTLASCSHSTSLSTL